MTRPPSRPTSPRSGTVLDRIEAAPVRLRRGGRRVRAGRRLRDRAGLRPRRRRDGARIGDRHLEYGLLPGAGGSVRLSRALPPALARRLLSPARWSTASPRRVGAGQPRAPAERTRRGRRRARRPALPAQPRGAGADETVVIGPSADAYTPTRAGRRARVLLAHLDGPTVAEGLAAFVERRPPDFSATPSPVDSHESADDRPVSGRWFEQLRVGMVVQHVTRRTVTETDNVLFTTMTMNPAPLHLDADYAAGTEFGRPLVNSMFTDRAGRRPLRARTDPGHHRGAAGADRRALPGAGLPRRHVRVETEVVEARPSRSRPDAGIVVFEHRGVQPARRTGVPRPADRAHAAAARAATGRGDGA